MLYKRLEKELEGGRTHFVETCGLSISTYFSAMKVLWLFENVEKVKKAVETGDTLFGPIDNCLIWNLTRGFDEGVHVTDISNVSRIMLMNLKTLDWDTMTLKELGIPNGIPISGCFGDQHAAMVGQTCRKGEAKNTYGHVFLFI
ncbi:hypothetical protein POM88_054024 [Heracleum sosnowskyi]|uniref:glycerol kinase n=1 Tax=Heracleum sosnowskyi TaxID=360622 RepID=A0AAD8GNF5_9APIA|nr:hypothetical protein POM88_054024 [Heracleum sosnowskyi]